MTTNNDMNIPIILWADLETAPLGQKSRLQEDFAGKPLLRHTLERVCRSEKSGAKIVFCRPEQVQTIRTILAGLNVEVMPIEFDRPKWWPGLVASRKWASDCWRGGMFGICAFDEATLPYILVELAKKLNVPAVLAVDPHGAWVDPAILDRQIEQYKICHEDFLFSFTQAPPGLAGIVLSLEILNKLPASNKIAGTLIGYHPTLPQIDLISKSCNLMLEPAIVQTGIRFTCDTQRSLALGRKLAEKLDPLADIAQITQEAKQTANSVLLDTPRELEIELVSGWPWPGGYRPSPDQPRGPIDADLIVQRVTELTQHCDDLLVFLGGFGEPSVHPELEKICLGLKNAGVWSLAMQTTLLIEPDLVEKIVSLPIDILSLLIDVPQRELYQKVMGIDAYEQVQKNTELLIETIKNHVQATPLLSPTMIKTPETMELMDEFFDGWFNRLGWAVINGFSDYAGQIPDRAVNSMAGPLRKSCRQIYRRMTILADGQVAICDQDFNHRIPVGSIREQSLLEIWQGPILRNLRESHLAGNFNVNDLCSRCRQWHRP